ncbi:MAG: FtsX-like permease family protein [bacterium]|nr:FtsX-like permease family protein [bacterium]
MFKNYLKVALRNIFRHKGYSFINITGLAIGMAVFMLILLFIRFEFSYDRFHDNFERIYRVEQVFAANGTEEASAACPAPLSKALKEDFPEFEAVCRVITWGGPMEITLPGNRMITADRPFFADTSFFDIFSFPLLKGDESTALVEPNTAVISENLAYKLFGDKDPMGAIFRVDEQTDLKITGVTKNVPANSHLKFDILVSVPTLKKRYDDEIFNWWTNNWVPVYVLLGENNTSAYRQADEKIRFALKKYQGENCPNTLYLKPLSRIHLYSDVGQELGVNGSIKNIYIFSAIALFVLLIACINFMNLTTARSADRAREVGVRKVSGAQKSSLVKQFLCESMLTSVLAMSIAFILVELLLPEFSSIVKRELKIHYFNDIFFMGIFAAVTVLVGILSGIYPAFFLSSYKPVRVLKGSLSSGSRNTVLRKSLVILQFSIGIVLIIGTVIVIQQVNHLLNKDLGYNSGQILTIPIQNQNATVEKNRVFRSEILRDPNVINAGVSDFQVIRKNSGVDWTRIRWEGLPDNEFLKINVNYVDENLMDTYGMTIVKGRGFSREFASDRGNRGNVVILNETAARAVGWDEPIGKRIDYRGDYRSQIEGGTTVVGIVKDYHFLSLHHAITPLMIRLYPGDAAGNLYSVKIAAQNIPATISRLKEKFRRIYPEDTFNYRFIDDAFRQMYREEQNFGKVIIYLAFLAIFIACLGLFGLASFSVKQRTKEIGIRKALGATVPGITKLLVSEFLTLTVIANLFAWPAAYFVMNQWLRNFPYRVSIHYWVFLVGGLGTLLLAMFTVGYQAVKSAAANPVEALKYE